MKIPGCESMLQSVFVVKDPKGTRVIPLFNMVALDINVNREVRLLEAHLRLGQSCLVDKSSY